MMLWNQNSTTKKKLQNHKHMEANQCTTTNKWVTEEIKNEIKSTWKQMKMKTQ